jgi:hypothetical protein
LSDNESALFSFSHNVTRRVHKLVTATRRLPK